MKRTILGVVTASMMLVSCGGDDFQSDASGVFEAVEVVVSAKVQGEITELSLEEGMQVKKGEPLGYIDITQLSLKKKQLEQNRKANDERRLSLSSQVASLKQQIENARKEKARFASLLKENAATQKQVDDIDYQISVLERQLAALTEQINSTNSSLASQSEGISSQISSVEEQMSDAIIASPIDGVILAKYAEQGEYASPGRALFKVADVADMKLRAYLSAPQVTALKLGQQVKVYADMGESGRKEYAGTVTWISSEAEFTPKTIQTREERSNLVYAVKVAVKNDGTIKRGMYGDLRL